jgi:hypothetical protein
MNALATDRTQAGNAAGGIAGFLGGTAGGMLGFGGLGNLAGQAAAGGAVDQVFDLRDAQIDAARSAKDMADAERDLAAALDDVAASDVGFLDTAKRISGDISKARKQDDDDFQKDQLDFAKQKKKVEDDAFRNNIKNQQDDLQRAAQLKESLKTDKERADDAMREAGGMRAKGLLTDADVNAIAKREAAGLARGLESQAGVGFAEKGSAAARQAVIESKQGDRQVKALERMVKILEENAKKEPIVVVEMGE